MKGERIGRAGECQTSGGALGGIRVLHHQDDQDIADRLQQDGGERDGRHRPGPAETNREAAQGRERQIGNQGRRREGEVAERVGDDRRILAQAAQQRT